eukprot:m.66138 g.66138  ORF g.66138 m.66138 type:complete len:263 (+) comp18048_c0_seq2:420-1208(+)
MEAARAGGTSAELRRQLTAERVLTASLQAKTKELQTKLNTLRRAKSGATRVVKGSTVHVNIPRLSKADTSVESVDESPVCDHGPILEALRAHVTALEHTVQDLTADVAALTHQHQQSTAANARLTVANTTLEGAAVRLEAEKAALSTAIAVEVRKLEQSQSALESRTATLASTLVSLEASETDRQRLHAALVTAHRECERQRGMIEAGGALADMARENQAELNAALLQQGQTERRLRAQLDDLRTKLSDVRVQRFVEADVPP